MLVFGLKGSHLALRLRMNAFFEKAICMLAVAESAHQARVSALESPHAVNDPLRANKTETSTPQE
jgi:hypothetical protein